MKKKLLSFLGKGTASTVQKIFDGEQEILKAQAKVANAMAMFETAAKNVELANAQLDQTIAGVNSQIEELMAKVAAADVTKAKAESSLKKNAKIITKLKDFMCVDED